MPDKRTITPQIKANKETAWTITHNALKLMYLTIALYRPNLTKIGIAIIGAARNCSNAHIAFGHQHVGLTGGPKTGRLIADMVNKKPNNADLSAFDPKRYS